MVRLVIVAVLLSIVLIGCRKHGVTAYYDAAYRTLGSKSNLSELADNQKRGVLNHFVSCATHEASQPIQRKLDCYFLARKFQQLTGTTHKTWSSEIDVWAKNGRNIFQGPCEVVSELTPISCTLSVASFHALTRDESGKAFDEWYFRATESVKKCAMAGDLDCIDALVLIRAQSVQDFLNPMTNKPDPAAFCIEFSGNVSNKCLFDFTSALAKEAQSSQAIAETAGLTGLALLEDCANSGNSSCMSRWAWVLLSGTCETTNPQADALRWFNLAARYGDMLAQSYLIRLNQPVPTPDLARSATGKKVFFQTNNTIKPASKCNLVKENFIKETVVNMI